MTSFLYFCWIKMKKMTDIQLYTKLSGLPLNQKSEVSNFIDFLQQKSLGRSNKPIKRVAGKAKGLVSMRENFDDAIEGFNEYI